ncbi:rCG35017, isoform CRA_a [Rattus norvegicus]|uniref:RCG35017, isoform CRA_a n=1 Tax=Rattus norvegicus TaxID=10116 RepID=A6HKJ7_RAT|nr:rCG35017, isoform CRA_a [Rattus norvegicus]
MTGGSEEDRNGRVSIRDDPDNLIFTVTLESLTMEDAGTYMCAVDIPLIDHSFGIDKFFKVELFKPLEQYNSPRDHQILTGSYSAQCDHRRHNSCS